MRLFLPTMALFALAAVSAMAQDPVKISPNIYKVEADNDQVRVLRVKLGPHEKSPMHQHPAYAIIYLTDAHQRYTFPDGKVQDSIKTAGEVLFSGSTKHEGVNLSDKPIEIILVELKSGTATKGL